MIDRQPTGVCRSVSGVTVIIIGRAKLLAVGALPRIYLPSITIYTRLLQQVIFRLITWLLMAGFCRYEKGELVLGTQRFRPPAAAVLATVYAPIVARTLTGSCYTCDPRQSDAALKSMSYERWAKFFAPTHHYCRSSIFVKNTRKSSSLTALIGASR